MLLMVITAGPDLSSALEMLSLDEEAMLSFAPEGLDLEIFGSQQEAFGFLKEAKASGRPVDIVLIDGPEPFVVAASVSEIVPSSKLAVVLPESGIGCPILCPSAIAVKRPLLPGELDALLRNLVELSGSRREFDGLFNSSSSEMALLSSAGVVAAWNSAASEATGVSAKNAVGSSIWDLLPFLKGYESSLTRVLENSRQERLSRILVETPGAEDKYYDVQISPMSSGRGAVLKIEDISNDVKKDEHLRQAQKMDSVGSLAAGLAHDFNNVIGGIDATMSSIKFSLDNTPGAEDLRASLEGDFELVDESVKRGKGIIEQLMSLSRRKEMPFSPADLNKMLADIAGICRNTFPKTVSVELLQWPEGEAQIMAFPTQIEQAFLNLCINACHAMTFMRKEGEEQGGSLSVSVSKIEVGSNITSAVPEATEGEYWLVSVSDTGIGMTREIMQRIFEPFFTTKEKGKGTGLGLAMVYNIIRQHKGFMDIFSEPGAGSTFLIFLPVLKAKTN